MKGSAHQFVGPEPALGVSRQNVRQKIKCWIVNQPVILWEGRTSTQSQVRGLMSGPCLAAKTKLLSFNRMQSRVVTVILTGHNILRRHLYIMVLTDSPLCRRSGAEEETAANGACRCETLTTLRLINLGSFFWTLRMLEA
jgi:hypothetical protein